MKRMCQHGGEGRVWGGMVEKGKDIIRINFMNQVKLVCSSVVAIHQNVLVKR